VYRFFQRGGPATAPPTTLPPYLPDPPPVQSTRKEMRETERRMDVAERRMLRLIDAEMASRATPER
jgi:hypothetical protein